ncbi:MULTISPECIES: hypothetical protein [Galbibacter]|uniref:Lipoprotein n=1 Tax=Galbibacter pacificus TaxID=2996052 RepID=A0ABT6FMZ1_9FLAO|nr:hypothetical protein [Galbibacter pacificus]MDG3581148.1 hypothetical protein [Galbibacter pacificus]MDG3584626.1 hypothetical protein [Galbibacter pacificus]
MIKKSLFIGLMMIITLSFSCTNDQVTDTESLYKANQEKPSKIENYQLIDKDEIENPRDKG